MQGQAPVPAFCLLCLPFVSCAYLLCLPSPSCPCPVIFRLTYERKPDNSSGSSYHSQQ